MKNSSPALLLILLPLTFISCQKRTSSHLTDTINTILDSWHKAASEADFESYFGLMTPEAVFIGTDAVENWTRTEFEAYAKPYFDQGKAWSFTCLKRTVYISEDQQTVWFDELLDTSYKLCRGSGVLVFSEGEWKVCHYVLSMTVPNEIATDVVRLKDSLESILIKKPE